MNDFKINPIEQGGQRVLTTAQLAEAYGTDSKVISYNFNHNKTRYIEGVHFYCLTGKELKKFFANVNFTNANVSKIRTLYLWTEKGALLHAKSLNTDKAWEVYEFLVDTYFRVQAISNSYTEILDLLRNDITSDIEGIVSKVLDERIETTINKALDKKFRTFAKSSEKISERIIIECVSETAKSLVTYFDTLIKILNDML
ncbi:MAG: ORF6N domain-containing protein [Ruminococcus sp.]|nr:ORF6N domain-containing protein [Ruminococcus sp.]